MLLQVINNYTKTYNMYSRANVWGTINISCIFNSIKHVSIGKNNSRDNKRQNRISKTPIRDAMGLIYFIQDTAEFFLDIHSKSVFLVINLSSWFSSFLRQGSTGVVAGLSTRGTHTKSRKQRELEQKPHWNMEPKTQRALQLRAISFGASRPTHWVVPITEYNNVAW